jgi:CBS domain-containing protein
MTARVVTCTPETALDAAVTLMTRNQLHRLVVMDGEKSDARMVGMVSMTDVIEATLGVRED